MIILSHCWALGVTQFWMKFVTHFCKSEIVDWLRFLLLMSRQWLSLSWPEELSRVQVDVIMLCRQLGLSEIPLSTPVSSHNPEVDPCFHLDLLFVRAVQRTLQLSQF